MKENAAGGNQWGISDPPHNSPAAVSWKNRVTVTGALLLVTCSTCVPLLGSRGELNVGQQQSEQPASRRKQQTILVAGGSRGPRPPSNDQERKWAELPEYHPDEHLLFFAHIIKTSGTSLSFVLRDIFGEEAVVPTSHESGYMKLGEVQGHDDNWWAPYEVMYGHNPLHWIEKIDIPPSKTLKFLLVVRNPLLHKASVYSETVCRFGRHIHGGVIDLEEATLARIRDTPDDTAEQYAFCRDPELWVDSEHFASIWRNIEAVTYALKEEDKHRCVYGHAWVTPEKGGDRHDEESCNSLKASGKHNTILEEYYDRMAESAIKRLGDALWVGVTERSDEADCLLFLTLGKGSTGMGSYRHKEPRPISVWHEAAMSKVTQYDQADWKVFNAANDILDLRIWTARERLKHAGQEELERLGKHCVNVINGL
ncbi:unnamed protein product [Ectocarpus sp. 4 AP-2014]